MRETLEAKARRYLREGRVQDVAVVDCAAYVWVLGSELYRVVRVGERWACTCPARVGRCCHVVAAEAATGASRHGSRLPLRLRFSAEEILGLRREVSRRRREEADAQLVRDRALFADAPLEVPPQ